MIQTHRIGIPPRFAGIYRVIPVPVSQPAPSFPLNSSSTSLRQQERCRLRSSLWEWAAYAANQAQGIYQRWVPFASGSTNPLAQRNQVIARNAAQKIPDTQHPQVIEVSSEYYLVTNDAQGAHNAALWKELGSHIDACFASQVKMKPGQSERLLAFLRHYQNQGQVMPLKAHYLEHPNGEYPVIHTEFPG